MRKIMFTLCVLISAACLVYVAIWLIAGQRQVSADRAVADRFEPVTRRPVSEGNTESAVESGTESVSSENDGSEDETSAPFSELLEINADVVGWIKIEGTLINYPVLRGRDNDYYLTHNLYNELNSHGAVFMDYRCEWDDAKIIFGHNMKDGTMFRALGSYKDDEFRREHDTILLYDIQGVLQAYRVDEVIYWTPSDSPEGASLYEYLVSLNGESVESPPLYLVTCYGSNPDARLIIAARREGAD